MTNLVKGLLNASKKHILHTPKKVEEKEGLMTEKLIEELESDGFAIVENLMEPDLLIQISKELNSEFKKTPLCQGDFYGWNTKRFGSLFTKAPSTQKLALHSKVLPVLDHILGPNCDWYQLNVAQAVRILPGSMQQPPHRDQEMWPCQKDFEYMVNVMWAIDDFTEENGATIVYPRSHTTSEAFDYDNFQWKNAEPRFAEMPKGSALVFLGSLIHGGGANISLAGRTGIIMSYSLGWLKGSENQFLTYPPEVARTFPKEIQELLGYKIHMPNLGGVESHCPSVLLEEKIPDQLPAIDYFPPEIQDVIDDMKAQKLLAS